MRHSCILVVLCAAQDPSGGVGEGCKGRIFSFLHLMYSCPSRGVAKCSFFFSSRASRPSRRLSCASFLLERAEAFSSVVLQMNQEFEHWYGVLIDLFSCTVKALRICDTGLCSFTLKDACATVSHACDTHTHGDPV